MMNEVVEHVYFIGPVAGLKSLVREYTDSGDLEKVRQEDGCLRFEFYYSAAEADRMLLSEHWSSQAALDAHHKTDMMDALKKLIAKYQVRLEAELYNVK